MTYDDCEQLPFLTKCIVETLRLWTAVPNGTFRELQHDDEVLGAGGRPVRLKKGTYVQVRHALGVAVAHRTARLCVID